MSSRNTGSFYATDADTKQERALKFLKRNALVIALVLVAAVTFFVVSGAMDDREAQLSSQRSEVLSLKGQLSLKQDELHESQGKVVEEATGGMSIDHKDDDDEKMTELMRLALTWDGLSEYLEARDQVKKQYGFAEDSQFMQVFMPGEGEGATRTAPSGKTYSAFDKDANSKFVSLNSVVTGTAGDVYSYFSIVEIRVSSGSGAASTPSYVVLSYDMIDGKPANLDAYTVPGGVKNSG